MRDARTMRIANRFLRRALVASIVGLATREVPAVATVAGAPTPQTQTAPFPMARAGASRRLSPRWTTS